ncbi:MAG: hypothetical protein NT059_08865 [Planctomycetota bacterium]|nr:hypothetical protein [Planctomycetota bacterium]
MNWSNWFMKFGVVLCIVMAALSGSKASATDYDRSLGAARDAQVAYERGVQLRRTDAAASLDAFRESTKLWERIRAAGAENGPLEFNLGNAYMESGDIGHAIAAYLRAERFMPGDSDLEHNLARARAGVKSSFERTGGTLLVDSVALWWHVVPRSIRLTLGWLCWLGFWGALAAWLIRPAIQRGGAGTKSKAGWRITIVSLLCGTTLFGGSAIADEYIHISRPRAVLVETGVTLRKGNGDGFEPAFVETLGPGVESTVIEVRPDWLRIELPDGRSGWIRDTQATRL